jgi:hypothetical protein
VISVWGGARATKYLATPLGTYAILGAVIFPEQRKYSQQGQEFFLMTMLICGPFTAEDRFRSQASFFVISNRVTLWQIFFRAIRFSSVTITPPLLHSHISFIYLHHDVLKPLWEHGARLSLKCDGTRTETRFRLSAKLTSQFKLAGALLQSTTDSRIVRISGSNAGYTMFRGSVKNTWYPLHSPVSSSLPFPCLTVCHHVSTGL